MIKIKIKVNKCVQIWQNSYSSVEFVRGRWELIFWYFTTCDSLSALTFTSGHAKIRNRGIANVIVTATTVHTVLNHRIGFPNLSPPIHRITKEVSVYVALGLRNFITCLRQKTKIIICDSSFIVLFFLWWRSYANWKKARTIDFFMCLDWRLICQSGLDSKFFFQDNKERTWISDLYRFFFV